MNSKAYRRQLALHQEALTLFNVATVRTKYPFAVCCSRPWGRRYVTNSFECWETYNTFLLTPGNLVYAFHLKPDGDVDLLASFDGGHDES
jgi:hypothetical protein